MDIPGRENMTMMKDLFKEIAKWILGTICVCFAICAGLWFLLLLIFGPPFTKEDLIDNYSEKHTEISELKKFVNTIVPENTTTHIEVEGDSSLPIFHVIKNGEYDSNWNLDVSSKKTDTLLNKLGWTKETLQLLKQKLENANCISIENGEPCTIGFKRSGMGMYFYKVFDKPLTNRQKDDYNDGCTYVFYKENIVLEYGGGAIGSQCFEDFDRSTKKK